MFGETEIGLKWFGSATFWIAVSTVAAAIFVAIQAWYARVQVVEAANTRLLERELDFCLETFDEAEALDAELKSLAREGMHPEIWPPKAMASSAAELLEYQRRVPPLLGALENGLMKGAILRPLDDHRAYLAQQIEGLGEALASLNPVLADKAEPNAQVTNVFTALSEFIGAQYLVFEGCKTVAQRTS
ncbi:hypothetical protein [Tropicimonas sp. IMCC6043]|uniref:hypothetical protein n=1 Tax=Tropicimonas sp. IMCC6043 TaxID=2510645 RepID=UPI00101D8CDC|nr:hypothetical protein [Tropicimonas sp. IMCC6043]RYH12356.1 hypothetical protein EU800_02010 [Tropicimonas sp. IMCC6043]